MFRKPAYIADKARYLFVRTRLGIENSDEDFEALADHWQGHVAMPNFRDEVIAWANGTVIFFLSSLPLQSILDEMRPALGRLDHWLLFDVQGEFVESAPGPASLFFEIGGGSARHFAQIYLMFNENDRRAEERVDRIKAAMPGAECKSAFSFSDGVVLFAATKEPAHTLRRRIEGTLKGFYGWMIVAADGEPLIAPTPNEAAWSWLELDGLYFGDDEDREGA